jgi:hypothetical protein
VRYFTVRVGRQRVPGNALYRTPLRALAASFEQKPNIWRTGDPIGGIIGHGRPTFAQAMMDALQQIGNWLAAGHRNLAYSLIGAGTALIGLALFIRLAAPKVSWR